MSHKDTTSRGETIQVDRQEWEDLLRRERLFKERYDESQRQILQLEQEIQELRRNLREAFQEYSDLQTSTATEQRHSRQLQLDLQYLCRLGKNIQERTEQAMEILPSPGLPSSRALADSDMPPSGPTFALRTRSPNSQRYPESEEGGVGGVSLRQQPTPALNRRKPQSYAFRTGTDDDEHQPHSNLFPGSSGSIRLQRAGFPLGTASSYASYTSAKRLDQLFDEEDETPKQRQVHHQPDIPTRNQERVQTRSISPTSPVSSTSTQRVLPQRPVSGETGVPSTAPTEQKMSVPAANLDLKTPQTPKVKAPTSTTTAPSAPTARETPPEAPTRPHIGKVSDETLKVPPSTQCTEAKTPPRPPPAKTWASQAVAPVPVTEQIAFDFKREESPLVDEEDERQMAARMRRQREIAVRSRASLPLLGQSPGSGTLAQKKAKPSPAGTEQRNNDREQKGKPTANQRNPEAPGGSSQKITHTAARGVENAPQQSLQAVDQAEMAPKKRLLNRESKTQSKLVEAPSPVQQAWKGFSAGDQPEAHPETAVENVPPRKGRQEEEDDVEDDGLSVVESTYDAPIPTTFKSGRAAAAAAQGRRTTSWADNDFQDALGSSKRRDYSRAVQAQDSKLNKELRPRFEEDEERGSPAALPLIVEKSILRVSSRERIKTITRIDSSAGESK